MSKFDDMQSILSGMNVRESPLNIYYTDYLLF